MIQALRERFARNKEVIAAPGEWPPPYIEDGFTGLERGLEGDGAKPGDLTRRGALRALMGGAAAVGFASLPGGNKAEAQDAALAGGPSGTFSRLDPFDMRRSELRGVRAGIAEVSGGHVALGVYGEDPAYIAAVEDAVIYLQSQGLPIKVVWGNGAHAENGMGLDVIIDGAHIFPKGDAPPYPMEADARLVAHAIVSSFERWQEFQEALRNRDQAAKPEPLTGG